MERFDRRLGHPYNGDMRHLRWAARSESSKKQWMTSDVHGGNITVETRLYWWAAVQLPTSIWGMSRTLTSVRCQQWVSSHPTPAMKVWGECRPLAISDPFDAVCHFFTSTGYGRPAECCGKLSRTRETKLLDPVMHWQGCRTLRDSSSGRLRNSINLSAP